MRRIGLGLLLAIGAVGALLQLTGGESAGQRRGAEPGRPADENAPEEEFGLRVEDGVAQAPDFEKGRTGEEEEAGQNHYFFGRAWSVSKRRGIERCTVVLERLVDGEVWGQPATEASGIFTVIAPPQALEKGALRVVIESLDGELGVAPASPEEGDATYLGRVRLTGRSELEGRVEDDSGNPIAGVRVHARRFGELTLLPGTVAVATTDAVGAFEMKRMPHGSFVVFGRGPEGRRFLAMPVLVPPDGPLFLRPAGGETLEATVRDTLDEPVVGARIEAIPLGADVGRETFDPFLYEPWEMAATDEDGIANLLYLRSGEYTLFLTLPDETTFEFGHHHAPGAKRKLRVPTDRRLRLQFLEPPPAPRRPPVPLRNVDVRVTLNGETSIPMRSFSMTTTTKTDEDGIAVLPLVGTTQIEVRADAPSQLRAGGATLRLPHSEGFVNGRVWMRPAEIVERKVRKAERAPVAPRRIRVTTAGGLPVEGARVYVRTSRMRKTNKSGVANVGKTFAAAVGHLFRPDLASGDPADGGFGARNRVDLHWNEGREITVRVVDAVDGFPLSRGVRLHPRPSAWRRVAPGVFRTRWDLEYADPEAELGVIAQDYEPWKTVPPRSDGPPEAYEARMIRPPELTAILRVEVLVRSVLTPGVRVSGRFAGNWEPEVGRSAFLALTGLRGAVEVAGLAEGPWKIEAEGGAAGSNERSFAMARGLNAMSINLSRRGIVTGTVIDDRGHAVSNARIEHLTLSKEQRNRWNRKYPFGVFDPSIRVPWVRTDSKGRFQLNLAERSGRKLVFKVRSPAHAETEFLVLQLGPREPLQFTVKRLGALDLPLVWASGDSGPPPGDIEVQLLEEYRGPKGRRSVRPLPVTARVVDGRLKAEAVPPGRVRLVQLLGSAWIPRGSVIVRPGPATTSPTLRLHPGGTIHGKVIGGKRAHVFISGAKVRVAEVGEHGEYRITGLPSGTYSVRADGQTRDSARRNRRIRVTNATTSRADILLR